MARIYKFVRFETEDATPFGRELLEEFPERTALAPEFEPAATSEELPDEEPPEDLEALREQILASARAEAEIKVQEAYQEGLARGTTAGREAFAASLAQCTEALTAATAALKESQETFLKSLEPQVLTLVKMLVVRIIEAEASTNPDLLRQTVRRALQRLAGQNAVTLHLHPEDLEALKTHDVSLLDEVAGIGSIQMCASDGVGPGGCIAQSESMEVDARLETLLGHALDALTE